MIFDAAPAMKTRLRADLLAAMKNGRAGEAKLVRTLIAAIDNAEAPPPRPGGGSATVGLCIAPGSAEGERLRLSEADLQNLLRAEIAELDEAAAELARVGQADRAATLRAEAQLAKRYLA